MEQNALTNYMEQGRWWTDSRSGSQYIPCRLSGPNVFTIVFIKSTTGPYPEQDESSSHPPTLLS
jgi:hypothetical protein